MTDPQELRRQARRLQGELARHGAAAVFLDDTGEPRTVPGYRPHLVGVYEQGMTIDQLAEDLAAALDDWP